MFPFVLLLTYVYVNKRCSSIITNKQKKKKQTFILQTNENIYY